MLYNDLKHEKLSLLHEINVREKNYVNIILFLVYLSIFHEKWSSKRLIFTQKIIHQNC